MQLKVILAREGGLERYGFMQFTGGAAVSPPEVLAALCNLPLLEGLRPRC